MGETTRVIHYLNQFFGGLGGEEQASLPPQFKIGPVGPGRLIQEQAPQLQIIGTVIAGDNYMAERTAEAVDEALSLIEQRAGRPDLVLAGPAFAAGRYGLACEAICRAASERFHVPTATAMHPENPAIDAARRHTVIVKTSGDVMGMRVAVQRLAAVALKLSQGEDMDPEADGTVPRGRRVNCFAAEIGARRAVEMLMSKLRGEAYTTEYPMPSFDRVDPAEPVADVTRATVALVTSGGIVPRGNPDHIESASASRFGEYSIAGLDALSAESHQTAHGGYDPTFANQDPNRVLPLDLARTLEREGRIGRLHDRYYATVGNGTSVERARQFGRDIAKRLVADGVQAVILTST